MHSAAVTSYYNTSYRLRKHSKNGHSQICTSWPEVLPRKKRSLPCLRGTRDADVCMLVFVIFTIILVRRALSKHYMAATYLHTMHEICDRGSLCSLSSFPRIATAASIRPLARPRSEQDDNRNINAGSIQYLLAVCAVDDLAAGLIILFLISTVFCLTLG